MKRRHAIVGALLGAAVLAVLVMPSENDSQVSPENPLRRELGAAATTFAVREALTLRLEARYYARQTVVRDADVVTVQGHRGMVPSLVTHYDSMARAYVASLTPTRDPSMRLIVTLVRDTVTRNRMTRADYGTSTRFDVFGPGAIRENECHVIVRIFHGNEVSADSLRRPSRAPFAACRPYLVYGTPGEGTAAWLATHNYTPLRLMAPRGRLTASETYGDRLHVWSDDERRTRACYYGRAAACVDVMRLPNTPSRFWIRNEPLPSLPFGWVAGSGDAWGSRASQGVEMVLHSLQQQLGADGMRAIWQTDEDFLATIERATGQPVAEFVQASIDRDLRSLGEKMPPVRPLGPVPDAGSLFLLMLIVVGLIGGSAVVCQRRGGFV